MTNWDDLRYFLAVSRKGSFVAAAAELRVTHSTVARRISTLEESLQTLLLQRTERGCTLTPAGEKLLPFAEQFENSYIGLEESVAGSNNMLTGAIRIGAPDGIGNSYLPLCLTKLQILYPSLDVELIPLPIYYSLSKREIDILITVRRPVSGNFITRKLTPYRLGIFASEDYLQSNPEIRCLEDLKNHQIVGYIDDLLFDEDLDFIKELSLGFTPQFKSATVIGQMNAVAAGAGIGVLPYFMVNGVSNLVPVLPDKEFERGYWLQVNSESRKLARVRTTIDFLISEVESSQNLFLKLPTP